MSMGSNGQWVRARNKAGLKSLMQERQMDAERRRARDERQREFVAAAARRIRSVWRRIRNS